MEQGRVGATRFRAMAWEKMDATSRWRSKGSMNEVSREDLSAHEALLELFFFA